MTLVYMYNPLPVQVPLLLYTDRNITAQLKEIIRERESLKDNLRFVVLGRFRCSFVFYG